MKETSHNKFTEPFGFSVIGLENSYITYQSYELYYMKFKHEKFSTIVEQYKKLA
jgi:hypothetical protein